MTYESFEAEDHLVDKGEPVDTDSLFFRMCLAVSLIKSFKKHLKMCREKRKGNLTGCG